MPDVCSRHTLGLRSARNAEKTTLASSSILAGGTLARSFRQKLSTATLNYLEQLVPAADAMPEVNCGFVPTAGKLERVRTLAERVKHLAATNYMLSAVLIICLR